MPKVRKLDLSSFRLFIKQLPLLLLIVFASIFMGVFLLTSTFLVFPEITTQHIKESAYSFVDKSARESVFDWCYSELDNWTDALILQISADNRNESALNRSLLAYHGINEADDGNPASAIVKHYIDGKEYDVPDDTYGRYWHGYILFIRPLLSIMSYPQIRVLNAIFQLMLSLIIIILLFKKNLKYYIIPYIISIFLLNPIVQTMSLQYSPCFYIFSIGSIVTIVLSDKQIDSFYSYLFLLIGIGTSFFDFLTYPISTLGIPLVFYLCRIEHNKFPNMVICVITWCIGYVGMWAGKWFISNFFTYQDVLSNAISSVRVRTSSSYLGTNYSLVKTILENLKFYFANPISLLCIPFLIVCISHIIYNKKNVKKTLSYAIPYLLTCFLPILWYAFTLNHSAIHSVYTHKSCIVICFSFLCMFSRISFTCPSSDLRIK